jgi:large conductance mechanosensitive channel
MPLQVLPPSLLLHRKSKNCFILAKRESLQDFPVLFFSKRGLRLSFSLAITPKIRYHRSKYVSLRHKGVDFLMAEKEIKGIKKFFEEFKAFAMRGNVLDMAVGVVIGGAFTAIVNSLVNDIINPAIGLFFNADFSEVGIHVGDVMIGIGAFITAIINFLIVAFVLFVVIKTINALHKKPAESEAPAEPTTKVCPYCQSEISIKAVRCPHCTSKLEGFPEINN